jgi:hypothetical protein
VDNLKDLKMYKKTTTITEEFDTPPLSTAMGMHCPTAVHAEPALLIQLMEYTKTSLPTTEQITTMVERMYMMSAACTKLTINDYAAIIAP